MFDIKQSQEDEKWAALTGLAGFLLLSASAGLVLLVAQFFW
jgi:hypothetical protein